MMRSLRWLLLAAIIAAATAQHVSQPHTVVQGVDGAKMTTTTVEYVVDGKKYTKTYNSKDNAPNTMEGLKKEAEELARKKAVAQGLIHENDKTGEFWIVDPNENLDYHLSTDPNGQVYAVPGAEGKTDAKAPAAEAPKAWYDHQSDPKFDPFLNPSLLPIHREHRSLKGLAHNSKHPIVFAESPLYHHLQRHIRRVTHFIKLRHGDAVRILGVIRGPQGASGANTPEFQQMKAQLATEKAQIKILLAQLRRLKVIETRLFPHWAAAEDVCPDEWTFVGFTARDQRVWCNPPGGNSATPGNPLCKRTAKFPQKYNRQGWSQFCKAPWAAHHGYELPAGVNVVAHEHAPLHLSKSLQKLLGGFEPAAAKKTREHVESAGGYSIPKPVSAHKKATIIHRALANALRHNSPVALANALAHGGPAASKTLTTLSSMLTKQFLTHPNAPPKAVKVAVKAVAAVEKALTAIQTKHEAKLEKLTSKLEETEDPIKRLALQHKIEKERKKIAAITVKKAKAAIQLGVLNNRLINALEKKLSKLPADSPARKKVEASLKKAHKREEKVQAVLEHVKAKQAEAKIAIKKSLRAFVAQKKELEAKQADLEKQVFAAKEPAKRDALLKDLQKVVQKRQEVRVAQRRARKHLARLLKNQKATAKAAVHALKLQLQGAKDPAVREAIKARLVEARRAVRHINKQIRKAAEKAVKRSLAAVQRTKARIAQTVTAIKDLSQAYKDAQDPKRKKELARELTLHFAALKAAKVKLIRKQRAAVKQLKHKAHVLKAQVHELKKQLAHAKTEAQRTRLQERLEEARDRYKAAKHAVHEARKSIRASKKKLRAFMAHTKEKLATAGFKPSLTVKKRFLNVRKIQLKLRLANLKKQLANAKGPARKELRKKIFAAKAKLRAVKRKLSAVKEKIALRFNTLSPAEKLRLSKKRLHYLKKKIARLTAKWENATGAERAKLYHKLKAVKHAVAKVKKIIKKVHHFQSTHTVKKAATRTIRKAKAALKKAKRAADHLQKLLHQLRHAKAKGASAEELEKLKERLRHARRRVRSQARHARRLARKLRRVERKAARAIIQGEHKKKKLRSLIERLNNKLDKAKEGSAEYAKLKERLHKAEKAFDKADARTERAYRILAKTRRTLSKVKKTLHKLTKLVKKTAPKHPGVDLSEHHHKGLPKKFHGPIQKLKKLKKLLKTLDPESPEYHKVKAKMKKLKKHIVAMAKKKIAALKKKLAETPVDSPHYAKLQKKLLKAKKILHKVKKIVKVVKTAVKVYAVIASGGSAASIIALADKKAILKAKLLRIKKALKHTADDSPRYQKLKALLKKTEHKLSVTKHKLAKANQAKRSAVIKNAQHKLAAIGHKQAKLRAKIMRLRNKLHAAAGDERKAILAKLRRAIHKSEVLKAKLHKVAKKAVHALKARSKFLKHQIKALKAKLAAAEDPAVRAKLHEKLLKLASKRAKALKKLVQIQKHQLRAERNFHARVVAQLKARRRQLTNASSDAQREHLRSVIENLEAKARKSLHKMVKLSRAAVKSAKKALKALKAQKKALKAVIKHALQNDPERAAKLQARLQKIKASIKKTKHAVQALKPKLAKLAIAHAHRLKTALRTLKAKLLKARLNAATLTGDARLRAQRRADHLASMVHNLSKKAKKAAKKAAKAIKHKLHNIKAKLIALRAQLAAGTGDSAEIIDRIRALKEKKRALKAALHKIHPLPAGAIKVRLRRLNTMLSKIRAQIKRQRALFKLADDGELKDAADSRLRKLRAKAKLLEEKAHRVRRKASKLFLKKIKNLRNRKEELQARLREPNVPYGEQAAINDEIASIDEHLSKAKHRLAKIKAKLARHDKIERSVEKMRENSEKLESEAAAVAHKAEVAIEAFNRKLITLRAAPQAERPKAKLQVVFAGKKAIRYIEDAKTATHQHLSALRNQRDKLNKVFKTAPISDRDTITSQVKEIEAKIKAVITSELHIASQKKDVKGRLYEVAPPLLSEVLDAKAEKKEKLGRLAERFSRRVRVLKTKIRNLYQRLSDIQDPKERAKLQERIVDLKEKKDKYKRKAVVAKLSLRRIIRAIKKINNKMSLLKERNQANREKVRELRHKQRETKNQLAAARNGLENAKYGSPEHEALKRKVEKLEARLTRIVVRKNFLKRQVEATHAKLFGALGKKGVVTELGHRIAFQKERKQEFERKHHRLSLKIESLNDELLTLSKDDPKRKELDQKIADLNHKKFNLAHKIEKITLKVERLVHKKLVAAKVAAKASVESKHAATEEKKAVAQEKKAIAKKIAALNAKERALSTKAAKIVKESKILDAFIRQQQLHLSPDALEALRDKQNALNEKKATLHEKLAKVAEKRSATNKHLDAVVAKTASHLSPVQQAAASKQLHLQTRAAELKARIEIKEKAMAFASDAEKLKIKKDIEHLAKKASVADAKLKVANIKVEKAQLVAQKQGLKSQIADLKVELDGASHARAEEIHAEIRKIKSNIADINDKKKELNNALKTAKVELKAIKKVNGPKPAGTPLNVVTHGVVCDADHAYISCESGSIQIQSATYGRMSFEKCYPTSDAVPRNPRDLACHRDVGAKLQAQCYGKRECQIDVIPQALGADLCPHVFKYLDFTYKCVNAGGALPTNAKHN